MPKFNTIALDNSRICHRHFTDRPDDFHREGQRDFSVIIDDESVADELIAQGWPVKKRPGREEGDPPFMFMPVKVKFGRDESMKWIDPTVLLQTGAKMVKLDEGSIGILDSIDIESVDLEVRAYDWTLKSGKSGRSAELHGMKIVQRLDRFGSEYEDYLRSHGGIAEDEEVPF